MNMNTFFNDMQKLHETAYNEIIAEWGYSSVKLKHYLEHYYNEDINYAHKLDGININYILPYRKCIDGKFNGLYGNMAIDRLQMALEAKAVIMYSKEFKNEETAGKFGYEALRLFLRIKSFDENYKQLLTFDEFNEMVLKAKYLAENDYDSQYRKLTNICKQLMPKRDPVLYHYKREDFEPIKYENSLKDAYNKWMKEVHPTLLEKHKKKLLDDYMRLIRLSNCEHNHRMDVEEFNEKVNEYKAKLDKIKIRPISYQRFCKLIKKIREGKL